MGNSFINFANSESRVYSRPLDYAHGCCSRKKTGQTTLILREGHAQNSGHELDNVESGQEPAMRESHATEALALAPLRRLIRSNRASLTVSHQLSRLPLTIAFCRKLCKTYSLKEHPGISVRCWEMYYLCRIIFCHHYCSDRYVDRIN